MQWKLDLDIFDYILWACQLWIVLCCVAQITILKSCQPVDEIHEIIAFYLVTNLYIVGHNILNFAHCFHLCHQIGQL